MFASVGIWLYCISSELQELTPRWSLYTGAARSRGNDMHTTRFERLRMEHRQLDTAAIKGIMYTAGQRKSDRML